MRLTGSPAVASRTRLACALVVAACTHAGHAPVQPDGPPPDAPGDPGLGAHPDGDGVRFQVASTRATRIELWIYAAATGPEMLRVPMTQQGNVWTAHVAAADLPPTIYYGYRVWGPNWTYDPAWTPASHTGWIADVDSDGNRMNPNKLVFDPYARELSHDSPGTGARDDDDASAAAKGIVLRDDAADTGARPDRPLRDDIIYEVQLRGFTQSLGTPCAGTYAGAAAQAPYLASLGVTAVEFLPLAETRNDHNDDDPTSDSGDNYWGYSTLAYFAPDRHYACDRTPGGPTRELHAMVKAFHDANIKVLVDVVYNHTAEGGGGSQLSLRGIDNAGYYQLDKAGTGFTNSNGVGADVATDKPLAAALVLDSLRYWHDSLGVDGFRFDLAPVLGNVCGPGCFKFDPAFPARIAAALPGAPLIAEPWGVVAGSYEVGHFPAGWSEWNDRFRDTIRADQNQFGTSAAGTPGWLSDRIAGSTDLYHARSPEAGVSYLVSHDGFTLHDLYACNAPNNTQAWPYGPSNGGSTTNHSWDHNGDAAAQRQAVRTGLLLMMTSAGVPMITGGDELGRSLRCNNNPYNLDSPANWLDYSTQSDPLWTFASRLFHYRTAHPELRPAAFTGDYQWYDATGSPAGGAYMDDATKPVLAWRIGATYVAYNRSPNPLTITLPSGPTWYRVADTGAWMEPQANSSEAGSEYQMHQAQYTLAGRSAALFLTR
ncbi:MAG: glycogen-debranching protein [Deltaproteobacteria bacterium]|nr:glycogen-debranching protein [Deltaproteobacteria bacterium]